MRIMYFKKVVKFEEMGQVDVFSVVSMVMLNKMVIKKGIRNNFDFSCVVKETESNELKVEVVTSENSEFDISEETGNFKINFFFEAKAK